MLSRITRPLSTTVLFSVPCKLYANVGVTAVGRLRHERQDCDVMNFFRDVNNNTTCQDGAEFEVWEFYFEMTPN